MKKITVVLILAVFIMPACSSYSPQVNLPTHIRTVAVPVFVNKTERYNIEQYVTQKTIDKFLADGKVAITDNERNADGIVKCRIKKYMLTPIRFDEITQVPQEYRLRIYVDVYFFDNVNQRLLWKEERDIWEETTYYVVNDLGMPAEDENIGAERVMDKIAERVVRRVIYGW